MKKLFISLVAIAAAVFATSCTNDLLDEGVKGGNRVTFNISTPELATRAFGDGTTATDLYYAVYEGNTLLNDISVTPGETPVRLQDGKTSIMLDLASGITYNLIFWAAAPDAIGTLYNVDFANKSMSLINPDTFVSQNENLDAFYAYVKEFDPADANADTTIELYRPFAQLNAISTDAADALANSGVTISKSTVKAELYNSFNLTDGTVSNLAEKTLEAGNILSPELLSMNYLFAPAEGYTPNVTFTFENNKGIDFDIDELKEKEFKKNSRLYLQKVIDAAIEIAYKSFFKTNKLQFIKKAQSLITLQENLKRNGHLKLHFIADLC